MRKNLTYLAAAIGGASLTLTACGGVESSTGGGEEGSDYPSGTVEMYVGASAGGSTRSVQCLKMRSAPATLRGRRREAGARARRVGLTSRRAA